MAKIRSRVAQKQPRYQRPSLGITLAVAGVAIVAVFVALWMGGAFQPKPAIAGDVKSLSQCGGIPCPARGDAKAAVTIVEVADFNCTSCKAFHQVTQPDIEEQYIKTGKVRYVAHIFGFNAQSQGLAAAALCAGDQGKYWEYAAQLFEHQGQADPDSISGYAQNVGIDVPKFAECVNSGKYLSAVRASTQQAQEAGIKATPSFLVNDKFMEGALPFTCKQGELNCIKGDFRSLIEAALQSKS